MSFEINVAKRGKHVFATHERSLSTLKQTAEVVSRLEIAFPEAEGYTISVTYWERVGETVEPEALAKEIFKNKIDG